MSSLGSPNPFFIAGKKAYEVERSLRFNDDDDTNLNRTPSSAGNRRTFTYSSWIKRCTLSGDQQLIIATPSSSATSHIRFDSDDTLNVFDYGTDYDFRLQTTQLFRDPSAWYHIVVAFDTTQSTSSDRVKIYVNGTQVTSLATSNYPSQDHDTDFNNTVGHYFGKNPYYTNRFDGYMAEINFIDGLQLTPSSFAETDSTTGQWVPIDTSSLTFGTNGYRLQFSDNSGTTATTLGKDTSGNSNNFTPNNFSVSAGTGNDSLEDTPTNNFCTLNPLDVYGDGIAEEIKNGNLEAKNTSGGSYRTTRSTFHFTTGKWYWEVKVLNAGSATLIGVAGKDYVAGSGARRVYNSVNGQKYIGSGSSYGASFTTNDIIGVALDLDNGTITFYKNGSSQGVAFTDMLTAMVDGGWTPVFNGYGNSEGAFNFGQRAFDYTQPTGYKKLNSANLPDPTILLPNQHFNTVLYSGDGNSTKSITGVGFKPDWLWLKGRNTNYSNLLYDAVRGAGLEKGLNSNETRAEGSVVGDNSTFGYLNSFDSDGFSVTKGSDSTSYTNGGSSTYVAWNWNGGDTDGKTYTVTVVDDSGNKFRFDGFGTSAVTLDLAEGGTYIFNYPSAHPLKFSTTSDGTHGGGSEYTTGVTHNSSTQVTIVVAASAPTLYYYCSSHSGMGGQVNTNSTLGSSNFDGTGQATVKTNTSSGFSIVTYTGNATGSSTSAVWQTIGHGLGVTPQVIIMKSRSYSDADTNWATYHHKVTDANTDYLKLNATEARVQTDINYMGSTLPTSSVFSLGYNFTTNKGSEDYVAYCFSEVAGYSKFGSYVGNGNSSGPFTFCGFRPAWVLVKGSSFAGNWNLFDNKRPAINVTNDRLFPNLSSSETDGSPTNNQIDILSNGFKLRGSNVDTNSSGDTYIYLAFAESPFKNARAR